MPPKNPSGPPSVRRTRGRATAETSAARNVASLEGRRAKSQEKQTGERWVLRLYVTGVTHASAHAVERVRAICEEHLHDRYELEVIDIYQLPALAKGEQIVATPTLIRVLPAPLRRYIGNLSNEKIIFGLDLRARQ